MNSSTATHDSPCDRGRLEQYLAGATDARLECEVALHLSDCRSCREFIEADAADPSFWTAAAEYLDTRLDATHSAATRDDAAMTPDLGLEAYLKHWLQPSDDPTLLGTIDKYQVRGVVGVGGMGLVLRAHDPALHREVAIKTPRAYLTASEAARKRFLREARTAASIDDPNVIPIFHIDSWREIPYIVMPLIGTGSLRQYARQNAVDFATILQIGGQIASGLAAAHQLGLVHRDIKPSNILLLDGVDRVVIADFGLARAIEDGGLTLTGTVAGTPEFMSPEQARGDTLGTPSDLFSLGSVLYWMCVGLSPFVAESNFATMSRIVSEPHQCVKQTDPRIPAWFDRLLDVLLAKNPDDRKISAAELSQLLLTSARTQGHPVGSHPCLQTPIASRFFTRRLLVTCGLGLLVAGAIWLPAFVASDPGSRPVGDEAFEARSSVPNGDSRLQLQTQRSHSVTTPVFSPLPDSTPDEASDGVARNPSSVRQRQGPIDALDHLSMMTELSSGVHVEYWLGRLARLRASEIPPEVIPVIETMIDHEDDQIRKLAADVLNLNPFESDDAEP
ncbi:MAG: serine/threonine-protein kinase [Pirellulaceae bacterium]